MSTPLTNRKINLLQATSINMIDMVGIGPFVVMPFVVSQFNNGLFLWAWIFGAITAFVDAMIWSELGAKYPLAGGTYNFHRIAYGEKDGKMMSFLFVWQTSIQAPLVVASGAIGFAQYLTYIIQLDTNTGKNHFRKFSDPCFSFTLPKNRNDRKDICCNGIDRCSYNSLDHHQRIDESATSCAINSIRETSFFTYAFWAAVGHGSVKTVYSYLGYYNVCHLGGEIKKPEINIPRSIFISIAGIAILYLLMNISVMGVIRWQSVLEGDKYLVSAFMESIYGYKAGVIVTVLILCIAFSSLFAVVLGYSRVPYAAAVDGNFFKVFSKLHPTKNFPYVSLIFLCASWFYFQLVYETEPGNFFHSCDENTYSIYSTGYWCSIIKKQVWQKRSAF